MNNGKSNTKHEQFDPSELERQEPKATARGRLDTGDDELGDPEGAARRANPEQGSEFPPFVYEDFDYSDRMANGQKWDDGKRHLVPKKHTIDQILELHDHGMQPEMFKNMKVRANQQDPERIQTLLTAYRAILAQDDNKSRVFDVMRSVGDICNRKLAERALRKYQCINAFSRADMSDGNMPDWVDNAEARLADASVEAGIWSLVHGTLYLEVGYSNEPQYYVKSQIIYALNDQAKFFETRYKRESAMQTATSSDYAKMALNY